MMRCRAVACALSFALTACTTDFQSIPNRLADPSSVAVEGMARIRYWGDIANEAQIAAMRERHLQEVAVSPAASQMPLNILAISGGAEDGAFGAGFLLGWSARGDRPSFTIVTGVSTGALIAPFAFLGEDMNPALEKAYTQISRADIYRRQSIWAPLFGQSLFSTAPLRSQIEQTLTSAVLAQIAAEHAKGRRLLIGTTDLVAQRPMIWNMGAIAAQGTSASRKLFHDVVLASASVPAVFPPVLIETESGEELHVDGGVAGGVFVLPWNSNFASTMPVEAVERNRNIFVLFNGRLTMQAAPVKTGTMSIASRSLRVLLAANAQRTLRTLQVVGEQNGACVRTVSIPDDFTRRAPEPFDGAYMQALFARGRALAASPGWQVQGPCYE